MTNSLLFDNWKRKLVSLLLAVVIWFSVHHSLTTKKTFSNVPVRIVQLPPGKTVEGMYNTGVLAKRISLTLVGKHSFLDSLSETDFEVQINASLITSEEWDASLSRKNLVIHNYSDPISAQIHSIATHDHLTLSLTKQIEEKIPLFITAPTGESPAGYQFLHISPSQLFLTVAGTEKTLRELKAEGISLTFNLDNLSRSLIKAAAEQNPGSQELSIAIPDSWKTLMLPGISDTPLTIDDPNAASLQLTFVRSDLTPIAAPIRLSLFSPTQSNSQEPPLTMQLCNAGIVDEKNGSHYLHKKLFVKGVTPFFLETVSNHLQLLIISPSSPKEKRSPTWTLQVVQPEVLEEHYVAALLKNSSNEENGSSVLHQQKLRETFRLYLKKLSQPYCEDGTLWKPQILVQDNRVQLLDTTHGSKNDSSTEKFS